jgi:hypothetical protein
MVFVPEISLGSLRLASGLEPALGGVLLNFSSVFRDFAIV